MDQVETSSETEPAAEETVSCGTRLREARERRGLSIKEAAATTRQSVETIAALENMDVADISPTFLRMHARNYANFLGLPGDQIAEAFSPDRSSPVADQMPAQRMRHKKVQTRRNFLPVAAAAGVLIAAGVVFFAWQGTSSDRATRSVADRSVHPIVERPSPSRATQSVASEELALRATRAAWIEVRASDGTIFRSRNMARGETYYPRMDAGWTITVRDAGAFEWWLADTRIGPVGEDSIAVYSVSVDEALARGREQLATALADIASQNARP
ncbi:MAG: helix-turn-helix domain-containing protein [Alphaproteobacteria bacterium]|nr:helix-turn-helix domain-containing protein [Alphaproteobacteria bacterium]